MDQRYLQTGFLLLAVLALTVGSCTTDPEQAKQDYLGSGNDYFAEGKLEEAAIEYQNAIQIDARFGEAHYRLGLCELERQRLGAALPALRNAVALQPKNWDAKLKLVDAYLIAHRVDPQRSQEFIDDTKPLLEELQSAEVEPYEVRRLSALVALAEKRLEDALEDLRKSHELRPDQPDVITALIQTLVNLGETTEAEKLAREHLRTHGAPAALFDTLYAYYVSERRFSDAEEILKEKVDNNPDYPLPRLQLAAHHVRARQPDQMSAVLQEMLNDPERFPAGRMHVGDFYGRLQEWDQAITLYGAGAAEDPERRGEYQKRIMRALIVQKRTPEAHELVEQALAENPDDRDTRALKAMLLTVSGERESMNAGVTEWNKLTQEDPDNAAYWYDFGQALVAIGDREGAQERFQQSIAKNWSFVPPRVSLAQIAYENGEYSDALSQADNALGLSPEHRQARLVRAMSLLALERYGEARAELEGMLRETPSAATVQFQLARLETKQGNYGEAERLLALLHTGGAPDTNVAAGLADVYLAQGQFEKARNLLARELEKQPDSITLRVRAAGVALRLGDTASALEQYRELVEQDPSSAQAHFDLANVYIKTGQFPEALESAREAAELAPNKAGTHLLVATLLEHSGRSAEADPHYRRVLDADPNNSTALNNLAFSLAESGEPNEALALAQRAVRLRPGDADLTDTLGWIYLKMDMSDAALKIFEQLVAEHPENPTYRYHFGATLLQTGDHEAAREMLESAVHAGPSRAEKTEIERMIASIK